MNPHLGPRQSTIDKVLWKRFGKLFVLEIIPATAYEKTKARCLCDCGKYLITKTNNLLIGHTNSCGCLRAETLAQIFTIHGASKSKQYRAWKGMIERCTNPKNISWKNYGKRGIKVCPEWRKSSGLGYMTFFKEMGPRPPGLSIHRVDNDLDYCKKNCIWTNRKGHGAHRQNSRFMWLNGVRRTLTEWSELFGLDRMTITTRLEHGWTDEEALTTPVRPHKPYPKKHKSNAKT